jgi:hypothetical protein
MQLGQIPETVKKDSLKMYLGGNEKVISLSSKQVIDLQFSQLK